MKAKRGVALVSVLLCAVALACTAQTPAAAPAPPTSPSPTPGKSGTLRFSLLNGVSSIKDTPWLMALDDLKAQGYTVEIVPFAKGELIPAALERGDIEVGSANTNTAWAAIAKGANQRTVVGRMGMTFYLVAKQDMQACRDLDGRKVVFNSRQATGYVMFDKYVTQNCPDAKPQIVLISDSGNRLAALQAGEVDAGYLEIEDWLQLDATAPGKYRVFLDFGKEFPNIAYLTFGVQRTWAEQHPEMLKDYIRALLTAHRRVRENPQLLRDEIAKRFSMDSAKAQKLAETYGALNVWDVNGGLTADNLASTIDFLASNGSVPQGMKVEDVADLSYLNAVLAEMGRQ
jgi:NitT/TauT family transport system substrate-binding protein